MSGLVGLVAGVLAITTEAPMFGLIAGIAAFGAATAALLVAEERHPSDPPVPAAAAPGLVDEDSGLFTAELFALAIPQRVSTARRYLRPLAVAVFDVDSDSPLRVGDVLRDTLRDSDVGCRIGASRYGLVLEDTPETGAVWALERVRRQLAETNPAATLWAGVACYPAHSTEWEAVHELALEALESAREWPDARIEVATSE